MQDRPTEGSSTAKRFFLFATSLVVGTVVWVMLGESESVTAAEPPASGEQKVLARVDGVAITEAEVYESIAGQLLKLERDRHELIIKAVDTQVRNALLDAAAAKAGVTKEELIDTEVTARLAEVPTEEVDAFYEARKKQIRATKEQVEEQIRKFIRYEAFMTSLQDAAEVDVMTDPFRVDVAATGPRKGSADAPVTIVEFSDFECPFCSRVNPAVAKVVETYGDKVSIVFRQFPLDIHRNARKAGEASLCADEQDKFWQMHDAMFADQKNLSVSGLKMIAGRVEGLDPTKFEECLDSGRHAETVENDIQAGAKAGVNSTPAFFINGRYLSGAQPFENFAEIIDEELGK
ncbi:MAG: DsbA family protein [Acidobacteriota bacterium]